MKYPSKKLTLDKRATYRIKVPGELDASWREWAQDISLTVEMDEGYAVTILTGRFDQASLQSLLRRLYSLGFPLISAVCVEIDSGGD